MPPAKSERASEARRPRLGSACSAGRARATPDEPRYPIVKGPPCAAATLTSIAPIPSDPRPGSEPDRRRRSASSRMTRIALRQRTKRQPPSECPRAPPSAEHIVQASDRPRRGDKAPPPIVATTADSARSAISGGVVSQNPGIQDGKPGGMQAHEPCRERRRPRADAPPARLRNRGIAESSRGISSLRGIALPPSRKRDRSKAGSRLLGSLMNGWRSASSKARRRRLENPSSGRSNRQSASSRIAGHSGEPVGSAMGAAADQMGLDLILAMMGGQQMQTTMLAAPAGEQPVARDAGCLLYAGFRLCRPTRRAPRGGSPAPTSQLWTIRASAPLSGRSR